MSIREAPTLTAQSVNEVSFSADESLAQVRAPAPSLRDPGRERVGVVHRPRMKEPQPALRTSFWSGPMTRIAEYTFLAPPLGVWRLAGVLRAQDSGEVFDPNPVRVHRRARSSGGSGAMRGCDRISTTGMTLRSTSSLRTWRGASRPRMIIAGAWNDFNPGLMFELDRSIGVLGKASDRCSS